MKNILGMTGKDLDDLIIDSLRGTLGKKKIKESTEKQKQKLKGEELKQFKAKPKTAEKLEDDDPIEEAEEETGKAPVKTAVTAEEVIELLNLIRSGRSLKKEEVRQDFQTYFDMLSGVERLALHTFTSAMADIISGENSEEDIRNQPTPSDNPVEPKKRKVSKPVEKPKSNVSGTEAQTKSASSPIVVGEAANKSKEKKLISDLKRF